ncbi:MAG: GNAT family N-acetyltransferase [Ruminococcus sp.]|nr:GNAT family N-acetyltransferase [Ruminococcus sp.]
MNFFNETAQYYCALANIAPKDFFTSDTPLFVRNPLLDTPLKGYDKVIDILVYSRGDRHIISYSQRGRGFLPLLEEDNIENVLLSEPQKIKYYYKGTDISETAPNTEHTAPRLLTEKDYPLFLDFFKACNPHCTETGWLYGYFVSLAEKRRCYAVFIDGKIVSATDSPDLPDIPGIPHSGDRLCEIGINTLLQYRRRGYAKAACSALINSLLPKNNLPEDAAPNALSVDGSGIHISGIYGGGIRDGGIYAALPIWSAASGNAPSRKLAKSLGFEELMRVAEIQIGNS